MLVAQPRFLLQPQLVLSDLIAQAVQIILRGLRRDLLFHFAQELDDIPLNPVVAFVEPVHVSYLDGTPVAYENRCPHLASPLSAGSLDGGVLTCGAHEWQFDARTGRGVNPASACLRRYPVRLDGEQIFVRL